MKYLLLAVAALITMTGCAVNPNISDKTSGTAFVYKPGEPVGGGPKFPVKVAVLSFKDGTEDFTRRGNIFDAESLTFNMAKSGIAGIITALTPELWAKAFADDMAAAGSFRAVRFVYSQTELSDEEFYFKGTLEKAYAPGGWTRPGQYVLWLQAVRKSDSRPVWEKTITRERLSRKSDFDTCGTKIQCMADRSHEAMNLVMQDMFAEAREDFMATQGFAPRGRAGLDSATAVTPLDPESVDETIEGILKGK